MSRFEDVYTAGTYDQSATADNATATVTLAAVAGKGYVVTGILATFSAAPAAAAKVVTLTWYEGGTAKTLVLNALMASAIDKQWNFPTPVKSDAGRAVTCTLTASGTGGVLGRVGLFNAPVG